jgi:hypothetical protein
MLYRRSIVRSSSLSSDPDKNSPHTEMATSSGMIHMDEFFLANPFMTDMIKALRDKLKELKEKFRVQCSGFKGELQVQCSTFNV